MYATNADSSKGTTSTGYLIWGTFSITVLRLFGCIQY